MLYPHKETLDASPKAISGRTSYLRVRLAFHRYPQLIHALFNALWFGPPFCATKTSPWPWIGHPVSGLQQQTTRPFRLAFASAPSLSDLTSLAVVTRWPILQKVRRHTLSIVLRLLVGIRFQVLFHSPPGVLFTFPSRYSPLSVAD